MYNGLRNASDQWTAKRAGEVDFSTDASEKIYTHVYSQDLQWKNKLYRQN